MVILLLFSFLAGVVTVLSPCVLPVLPAILSAGLSGGKLRPLGVVSGIICSFTFFTLALTGLVRQLGFSATLLRYTAILLIGFFGMVMIMPYLSDLFARITSSVADAGNAIQSAGKEKKSGFISGFLLGIALGLVWTPCAGPILAAISTLVATQSISFAIVLLTIAYSLGAGIPLLAIAYGGQRAIAGIPFLSRHSEGIRKGFGWIMLATALALAFNWDVIFQQKVLELLPNIQPENNAYVKQELEKLRPPPVGFPTKNNPDSLENPAAIDTFGNPVSSDGSHELPKLAKAPDITGITGWINSKPLTSEELRGKAVLVDFWTYSCINCIRTFPYLLQWYESYGDKGLVILGVHTPEFEFEKDFNNVKMAVDRFHIPYPVALDNDYKTWQAFRNAYWPAHYLIDQNGIVRQVHLGEGGYAETENGIRSLLGLSPLTVESSTQTVSRMPLTPETYLGSARAASYSLKEDVVPGKSIDYSFVTPLNEDKVGLQGLWTIEEEFIRAGGSEDILEINFLAGRVYLVLGGNSTVPIRVELDGKPVPKSFYTKDMDDEGNIFVKEPRKYDMVDLKGQYGRHRLTLYIPNGIDAYAFTFGLNE